MFQGRPWGCPFFENFPALGTFAEKTRLYIQKKIGKENPL